MKVEEKSVNQTNPCPYCGSTDWGMYEDPCPEGFIGDQECLDVYAECGTCGRFFTITLFGNEIEVMKLEKKSCVENIPDIKRFK